MVLYPLLFLYVVGAFVPDSEAAFGANYNLRALSPGARRHMSPFPAVDTSRVLSDRFYTLYVPGSGFLWSDAVQWEQNLPEEYRHQANVVENNDDEAWRTDGSFRAYFQDKFAKRYPWVLKRVPYSPFQTLYSNTTVRLFDPTEARYLCVIPRQEIVSEALYFVEEADQNQGDISRLRVG